MRNLHAGAAQRAIPHGNSAFRISHSAFCALLLVATPCLSSAQQLPPLPNPDGRGVHVLALAADRGGAVWVGTYGQGIYLLRPGAAVWEHLTRSNDSTARSISWDLVHAFAFGSRGEIWYGTVGNGWGVSTDSGQTWTNWEFKQLGPEWQYVAPNGIVTRGDTVYIATADGIKLSFDRGASWAEITDSAGAGSAARRWGRIASQYVLALAAGPDGSLWAGHLHGIARSRDGGRSWTEYPAPARCAKPECASRVRALAVDGDGSVWVGTERGLYRFDPARGLWIDRRGRTTCGSGPVVKGCRVDLPPIAALARGPAGEVYAATASGMYGTAGDAVNSCDAAPFATALLPLANGWYAVGRTSGLVSCRFDQGATLVSITFRQRPDTETSGLRRSGFRRPIALDDQPYIDQTYRFGSTMGGNFQQHQGVEFNNPDGTSVHAIGDGVVVFAGPAEQGSNTVAIRHDVRVKGRDGQQLFLFSAYYHNRTLLVSMGQRVQQGDAIAQVGNTGRATNDHLHLEVHASPYDSISLIVDPNERYPRYAVNPELWIAPLEGTGVVAGQVWDAEGRPVPEARVYGLLKAEPQETPYSYAETYGEHNHPDPVYQEHFAVSDVPPGDYALTVDVNGRRLTRRVRVQERALTWVVFRLDAH
jgi:peptidase M23-like protein/two component regulator with propeller domain